MSREIILYSAKLCGDCQKLKSYMEREGISFETRDVQMNSEHAKEVENKTGKLGVPYLVIDGEWVRGYDLDNPFSDSFAASLFQ